MDQVIVTIVVGVSIKVVFRMHHFTFLTPGQFAKISGRTYG